MILLVDAGNSRIKWRLQRQGRILSAGDVATAACGSLMEEAWQGMQAGAACVSSVAGEGVARVLRQALERVLAATGEQARWLVSPPQGHGIVNLYEPAESLGTDRFAALVAAHRRQAVDWVVVNVGTAMTVDMLTGEGRFLGGAIVPGPELMREALGRGTAGVRADAVPEVSGWPRNTRVAVGMGVAWALWGVVEGMIRQLSQATARQPRILLSGGARAALWPPPRGEVTEVDELVLEGLAWIARDLGYDA
jgi:type III pantothenate kinase